MHKLTKKEVIDEFEHKKREAYNRFFRVLHTQDDLPEELWPRIIVRYRDEGELRAAKAIQPKNIHATYIFAPENPEYLDSFLVRSLFHDRLSQKVVRRGQGTIDDLGNYR